MFLEVDILNNAACNGKQTFCAGGILITNRQRGVSEKMADREILMLGAMVPSMNLTYSNSYSS